MKKYSQYLFFNLFGLFFTFAAQFSILSTMVDDTVGAFFFCFSNYIILVFLSCKIDYLTDKLKQMIERLS